MNHPDSHHPDWMYTGNIARREFVALSMGAVVAATLGPAARFFPDVVETDVEIKTPDGICDAVFIHPKTGSHPGVLVWPDVFGLRPAMRDIGKRIAAEGYSVLVPNPFYRIGKTPFPDASVFNFKDSGDMSKLGPLMATAHAPGQRGEGCPRAHRVSRRAAVGEHEEEDRHPGLLHGWPDGRQDRRGGAGPGRGGRVVPWRRVGHRPRLTARIYWRRRSMLACISPLRRTTTRASLTRRTS